MAKFSSTWRVLVIDDDPLIRLLLKRALHKQGYVVDFAHSVTEGLRLASVCSPSVVLLDPSFPDSNSNENLQKIRAAIGTPILIVFSGNVGFDKIRALDAGADDYIDKPFAVPELLARVRACLNRSLKQQGISQIWRCRGIVIDLVRRSVWVGDRKVVLSPGQYDLLALLVMNSGRVVTYDELSTSLLNSKSRWNMDAIRVRIGRIRRKIGDGGESPIRAERRIGYRLIDSED
jgi:two-component system, OmpR family, KDP operon response regulator KdpE